MREAAITCMCECVSDCDGSTHTNESVRARRMRVDILPVCSRRTKDDANRRKASGREREGGRGRRRETERECVGRERVCVCEREREN